ncbi:MAG: TfoX/Sxy family protein [Thermoplasmata archaeon]
MKLPKASSDAAGQFEALVPAAVGVTKKLMFGQPAAFVNGNLFFGVFGDSVFVRLSEKDRAEAGRLPGFVPFEPMPGRAMKAYVVLPMGVLRKRAESSKWVKRSLEFVATLPPKGNRA